MSTKLAVTLLVIALSLTGWRFYRGTGSDQENQPLAGQVTGLETLGLEPVAETLAPDFALKDIDGKTVRLHDLKGKVVLLNFWATWCPSCRFEMPSMEALHKEYGGSGLAVLAIAFQEGAEDIRAFYREHEISFPGLIDPNSRVFDLYRTWSLPTTFVIDKRGYIVGKVVGYRDWHSEPSKAFFSKLLEESA